jgi:hypothetical protein
MAEPHETWTSRELPILRAALAQLDTGVDAVDLDALRVSLRMTPDEIFAAVRALGEAGYIDVELRNGWDGTRSPGYIDHVHERARRELGTWPTPENVLGELVAALSKASEEASEPEQKTRLRATADALSGFARDVAVAVVAKYVPG